MRHIAIVLLLLLAAPVASDARLRGFAPVRGARGTAPSGPPLLSYHGGPVMRTTTVYAIHWLPSTYRVASGYRTAIATYLRDVAADSGGSANVYSVLEQYGDASGNVAYDVAFGGTTTDARAFPASACHSSLRACLTDAQLRAEIARVRAAHAWPAGGSALFLLFLPRDVAACDGAAGASCAFSRFCAYHGSTGTGASALLYAIMPYAETRPRACGVRQHPVGREADAVINVLSHEHREAITDPFGTAWYDADGLEGSDKCAWNFGDAVGGSAGLQYTNLIHGHRYWLQQEWSNAGTACVQRAS